MQEEKQDQVLFVAGSFFFLMVMVPFIESFRPQPYRSTLPEGKIPRMGLPGEDPNDISAFEDNARRVKYVILGMTITEIDFVISGVICVIVLLVSMMCWPRPCDNCEEKLANLDAVPSVPNSIFCFKRHSHGSGAKTASKGPTILLQPSSFGRTTPKSSNS